MTPKNFKNFIISLILLLLVIIISMAMAYVTNMQRNPDSANEKSAKALKKQFVCSMHPEVIKDTPGDCPICGMSLIEKIDHDNNSADSLLVDVVRPVNESVLGSFTTVSPFWAALPLFIEASGIINFDSRKITIVSARFGGLVEKSFVKYQFQPIRMGQKIYEIYCPDIYADQWNYVKSIQMYPDQDTLTVEARDWLKLRGLTKGQIDSLKKAVKPDYHLSVYSEVEGYAVSADFDPENYFSAETNEEVNLGVTFSGNGGIGFNDGLTIETGAPLFRIVNLKSLRADLKVRSEDAGLLKTGQKVILTEIAFPDRKFDATVSQVEPFNGGLFQLVKVFFTDKEGLMKPGRQIQGQILAGKHEALWVPKSSVINLGQKHSVFVMQNGRFTATKITTGLQTDDKVEVLSGIDQNSKIASNALLLTDSDSFIHPDQQ